MADQVAQVALVDPQTDPYGYLGFVKNPDGSVTRRKSAHPDVSSSMSSYDSSPILLVKDIPINQSKNTWVRVLLPKQTLDSSPVKKLPLLIYIRGGGFVICRSNVPSSDKFYSSIIADIPVAIVSIEYRNAPEHRLPAAYEDCTEVLHWIKSSRDEWLTKYADFSNSFLMGSSAGGNIAYRIGLDSASRADDLKPLNVKGVILHQPFFGGTKRTESELRTVNDKILPICATDLMWELSLPIGVDRDHEFCNPVLSIKRGQFDQIKALGWKILVTGYEGDPLFDRQIELVKNLEENGVSLVSKFAGGGYHGIDSFEFPRLKALCEVLKEFVNSILTVTV